MILVEAFHLRSDAVGLGAGKRLYALDTYAKLRLIESSPCPTGVALLHCEPVA